MTYHKFKAHPRPPYNGVPAYDALRPDQQAYVEHIMKSWRIRRGTYWSRFQLLHKAIAKAKEQRP